MIPKKGEASGISRGLDKTACDPDTGNTELRRIVPEQRTRLRSRPITPPTGEDWRSGDAHRTAPSFFIADLHEVRMFLE
jgi:hypothetical protein